MASIHHRHALQLVKIINYIEIATLWSPTDSSKTSGTYNFPLTWNSALSNITSATLAINSFRVET